MSAEKITGICPSCYHELEIPADLTEFSCMYCGHKMAQSDLLANVPTPADEDAYTEAMDAYRQELPRIFRDYKDLLKRFTRKEYANTMDTYASLVRDVMAPLDRAVGCRPASRKQEIEAGVVLLLEAAQQRMEEEKGWEHRRQRTAITFDIKLCLALFFTPAIRRLSLSIAEDFAAELHRQWMAQHADCPYLPATYEDIAAGFRKRKFCFITTAICRSEGKPDDCAELTAFRAFRDGWLSEQPDGNALIEEYYDIAPGMVMMMDLCEDSEQVYSALRRDYLNPCYAALQAGRMEECKQTYTQMVQDLKQRYVC